MASQRLKRGLRGAMAATAVAAAAVGVLPVPAGAQPNTPANASEALKKYNELAEQATKLNEELLRAEEQRNANQTELDKANADLAQATQAGEQARTDEETFRVQVDKLTEASFEGARFNQLSALLVSDSQQDFLNRMSALGVLASDSNESLERLSGAVDAAEDARQKAADAQARAQAATDEAIKIADDVKKRNDELQGQITEVKDQLARLSASERTTLSSVGERVSTNVPAGAAGVALQFALDQQGDMYLYGATGPDRWDCSGLTSKAYAYAGVSIPRTSGGQAGAGRPVSRGEVQAGDLIIYNGGNHVGMAVDNGRVVHASTDGVPVKVVPLENPGSIYAMRRIAG
ncbi:C40 family peptidase [Saccharothrix sp. 6-C]|uniref:Cell wall-associated NlpC family hydrolase n=1 Tax=Saccharothrix texasensis TaxID=103734 RepID=A0A3N1H587_9PSEU|nr:MULTISPECIES: C40 family peptidase [Saccharothrix]QQQ77852.1 C40 family peptidase [Saccharothrix sp. 6-C]ROP37685.1 cell wall-associated NlpC family hydrolase [Saccharothrix texasensis]